MWTFVSTIGDLVDRQAEHHDNVALVIGEHRLTYPELAEQSDAYAASLLGLGVEPGDKVGILMHNCLEFRPVHHRHCQSWSGFGTHQRSLSSHRG